MAVAADHGEALGEHGELTHGLLLYEPTLHVPLLLRAPGRLAARVVETPVSLRGPRAPPWPACSGKTFAAPAAAGSRPLDGRDLSAALLRGRRAGRPPSSTPRPATRRSSAGARSRPCGGATSSTSRRPAPSSTTSAATHGRRRNLMAAGPQAAAPARGFAARLAGDRGGRRGHAAGRRRTPRPAPRLASLGYVTGAPARRRTARRRPEGAGLSIPRPWSTCSSASRRPTRSSQDGEAAAALGELEALVAADPANPVFRGKLAAAWRERGDIAQGRAALPAGAPRPRRTTPRPGTTWPPPSRRPGACPARRGRPSSAPCISTPPAPRPTIPWASSIWGRASSKRRGASSRPPPALDPRERPRAQQPRQRAARPGPAGRGRAGLPALGRPRAALRRAAERARHAGGGARPASCGTSLFRTGSCARPGLPRGPAQPGHRARPGGGRRGRCQRLPGLPRRHGGRPEVRRAARCRAAAPRPARQPCRGQQRRQRGGDRTLRSRFRGLPAIGRADRAYLMLFEHAIQRRRVMKPRRHRRVAPRARRGGSSWRWSWRCCPPPMAQTSGANLVGSVQDKDGAALPGVTVTATQADTGLTRTTVTESDGTFRLPSLPVGSYTVDGGAQRLRHRHRRGACGSTSPSQRDDRDHMSHVHGRGDDHRRRRGAAGADLALHRHRGQREAAREPAAQRPPVRQPGRASLRAPSLAYNSDPTKPGQLTVALNGGIGRNVNYMMDGGDNTDDTIGGALQNFNLESVAEFNIQTQQYKAEYGRSTGGVLTVVTKTRHQQALRQRLGLLPRRQPELQDRVREARRQPTRAPTSASSTASPWAARSSGTGPTSSPPTRRPSATPPTPSTPIRTAPAPPAPSSRPSRAPSTPIAVRGRADHRQGHRQHLAQAVPPGPLRLSEEHRQVRRERARDAGLARAR